MDLRKIITTELSTVEPGLAAIEVAQLMSRKNITSILVVEQGVTKGIISVSDFMRLVAHDGNAHDVKAKDIMSSPVITADIGCSLNEVLELMWNKGVRRIPITEEGKLIGIITESNLTSALRKTNVTLQPKAEEVQAEEVPETIEHDLELGKSYLYLEPKPEKSISALKQMISVGVPGLVITREDPKAVRKKHGIETTPILWLTNSSPDGEFVDPHNIVGLSLTVNDYMSNAKQSIVLMDGITYLITQNQFETVLGLIQYLRDNAVKQDAILLLSLNGKTLQERELELIKAEVDEVF